MSRIVLLDPKFTPHVNLGNFQAEEIFFHFQNFWDISMRKKQQQPPWLINFAKFFFRTCLKDRNYKSSSLGIIE